MKISSTQKASLVKGLKEIGRLLVLSIPGIVIYVISSDPDLSLKYGGLVLFLLKGIDKGIHENPNINANGLVPF